MIVIGHRQFDALVSHVRTRAADVDVHQLLDELGQTVEDAARRRILDEKRAPDGRRWAPWSERYARTRGPQHSLLRGNTGYLADSLDHQVDGDTVIVGSNLVYAASHQFGDEDRRIPARPFISDSAFEDETEREELRDVLRAFLKGAV